MSEQLYRVYWVVEGQPTMFSNKSMSKEEAERIARQGNDFWDGMIRHWVEPVPPYEPPAIVAEDDLTTAAGSPCMGGDDDLLGVKPPC